MGSPMLLILFLVFVSVDTQGLIQPLLTPLPLSCPSGWHPLMLSLGGWCDRQGYPW